MDQAEQALQSLLVMLWNAARALQGFEQSLRDAMGAHGVPVWAQTTLFAVVDVMILGFCARKFHGWFRTLMVIITVLILVYLLQPWAKVPGAT